VEKSRWLKIRGSLNKLERKRHMTAESPFSRRADCTNAARPSWPLRKFTGYVATKMRTWCIGMFMADTRPEKRQRILHGETPFLLQNSDECL